MEINASLFESVAEKRQSILWTMLHVSRRKIVPTAADNWWRKSELRPQVSKRRVESERLLTTFVTQQRGLFLF